MSDRLLAGAARVPITGTGRYGLGGPGRRRAAGIHDDVFARALAMSDGMHTVVLLTVDARGVPPPEVGALRAEVRRRITTQQLRIIVSGSAVGSGPDLLWEGRGCPQPYWRFLREELADVVVRAIESRQPARLLTAAVPMPSDLLVGSETTPAPALVAFSLLSLDGPSLATAAVLGCRPDVLGNGNRQVSADFLAPYHAAIEAARGGVSLALPGAVGDQTARDARTSAAARSFDAARAVGEALATPVLHALAGAEEIHRPLLSVYTCRTDLRLAWSWAVRHAWLRSLRIGSPGRVRAEVNVVRVGDVELCTVPGAPTRAAVAQLQGRSGGGTTPAVVACTDGMWGLLAPPETEPAPWADGWGRWLTPAAWPVLRDTLPAH